MAASRRSPRLLTRATRQALVLLAAGAAAAVIASSARSQPSGQAAAADAATGFDHTGHVGLLEARAVLPPPCTRCHAIDGAARLAAPPGHGACFGDCHGPRPAAGQPVTLE